MTDHETIAIRLDVMSKVVQSWIEWSAAERAREGLSTGDDTSIMLLPVPFWPSHGQFRRWIDTMNEAASELRQGQ